MTLSIHSLLFLAAVALLPFVAQSQSNIQKLASTRVNNVRHYEMHISLGKGSPDCFSRNVILINGLFQPTIEVHANDTLEVRSTSISL